MLVVMWLWEIFIGGEPITPGSMGFKKRKHHSADGAAHSFKTGRYLGSEGHQVHKTRNLSVVQKSSSQAS